jgi:hypothetical protein
MGITSSMNHFSDALADQLIADFHQEHQLVNLMLQGSIEYRWAVETEEREIALAMVYNAFEAYAIERGMSLQQAEEFCEQHLHQLIQAITSALHPDETYDP